MIITFIVFASVYCYDYFFSQKPRSKKPAPNSLITDMHVIKTDQNGTMIYRLLSRKAYHYVTENRSELTAPIGYYYVKQQPYWTATAEHGQTLNGDEIVHLFGHVYMHQDAGKNNHEITLRTSKAMLYPQKQIAENRVFVKVEQPGMGVTSVGFHANMRKGNIILLSKVQGYFVAENKQSTQSST